MQQVKPKLLRNQDYRNKDPVKMTALLYLRAAILKEEYETCGFFIQIAKEFGATNYEVLNILEDPRRMPYFERN